MANIYWTSTHCEHSQSRWDCQCQHSSLGERGHGLHQLRKGPSVVNYCWNPGWLFGDSSLNPWQLEHFTVTLLKETCFLSLRMWLRPQEKQKWLEVLSRSNNICGEQNIVNISGRSLIINSCFFLRRCCLNCWVLPAIWPLLSDFHHLYFICLPEPPTSLTELFLVSGALGNPVVWMGRCWVLVCHQISKPGR